jgi:YegS/Rv2252/BmrU family lipid kinase
MKYKKVHLVVNPAAGQPDAILYKVNNIFYEHHVDWSASVTTSHVNGTELVKRAIEEGADLIIASGGDGTVREIAHGLVGVDMPLALTHGGTGNALANKLNIPKDTEKAIELIIGDHGYQTIDVGKIVTEDKPNEPGYFLLRASVGLQEVLLEEASRQAKDRFGNFAYVLAGIKSLMKGDTRSYRIVVDGKEVQGEGLMAMIANSAAVGGGAQFEFAPNVDWSDGLLDVFILDSSLASLVDMVESAVEDDINKYEHRWSGREITIRTETPQHVMIDGEVFGYSPFTASVIPGAIKIVVPLKENE